jgi:phosphate:Na+ symporter
VITALPNEALLEIIVGAALTVLSYSGLAIVLLVATLVASQMVPRPGGLAIGVLSALSKAQVRSADSIDTVSVRVRLVTASGFGPSCSGSRGAMHSP